MSLNTLIFLVGRVLLGGYFIMSSINHFRQTEMLAGYAASRGAWWSSKWAIWVTGLMLFWGGLGILLGVKIVWAVTLLVVFLLVVSIQIHHFWDETDPQKKMGEMINFTKNIALLGATLMLLSIASADWYPALWP